MLLVEQDACFLSLLFSEMFLEEVQSEKKIVRLNHSLVFVLRFRIDFMDYPFLSTGQITLSCLISLSFSFLSNFTAIVLFRKSCPLLLSCCNVLLSSLCGSFSVLCFSLFCWIWFLVSWTCETFNSVDTGFEGSWRWKSSVHLLQLLERVQPRSLLLEPLVRVRHSHVHLIWKRTFKRCSEEDLLSCRRNYVTWSWGRDVGYPNLRTIWLLCGLIL